MQGKTWSRRRRPVLNQVAKFEIRPAPEQLAVLEKISENLRQIWNLGFTQRQTIFENCLKPIYERKREAQQQGKLEEVEAITEELKAAFQTSGMPTFYDQLKSILTPMRYSDPEFARYPRAFQEETLNMLDGGFRSFVGLRKGRDKDARVPRPRDEEGRFYEIQGRGGFKRSDLPERFTLSCPNVSDTPLSFPIPGHQQKQMAETLRDKKLRVAKFVLFKDRDGRFWVSLAYEIPKPETTEFVPKEAVYVALGATRIGVVSPKAEIEIPLGRPDKHWQPKIEEVKARMARVKKGSRKWNRLNAARREMETLKSRQQKQNRREVVQKLLMLGNHFVVTDLVVRSKPGKLADSSKLERGGVLGLNWAAQNSGAFGGLVAQLIIKTTENGGTVQKHPMPSIPQDESRVNKVQAAHFLRNDFLTSRRKAAG